MESEAGQKTFCVLQGDGYGTKIDFISLILFFLYFFSYLTLYNWFFFLFLIKIMRSCGHWTKKNTNLSSKPYVWPVCEGTVTFRAHSLCET